MNDDDEKLKAVRKMQELAAKFSGEVIKIPMGKSATKSKVHKHIGLYDKKTKTHLAEQSAVWQSGGGSVDVESLS
jgi:CMP-2-keto-3-deoxyoctulosonic acid synthetase